MQYIGHEKESEKMTDAILNSIGGITKDQKDIVKQIVGLHMYPHEANQWGTSGKAKFLRKTMLPGKEKEHKDLWKYVFYHTQADQMASQPDKYDQEKQNEIFNNFKNYVEKPSIQHNLLINGNEVKNIIQEGLVNKIKDGPWLGQVINQIRYLQDEEIIKTKEDAITKIKEMKPEILNIYNKQNNIIISFNWYKKIN